MKAPECRSKLLTEVEGVVFDALSAEGIGAARCGDIAVGVAELIARKWGGRTLSFPREAGRDRSRRDARALAMFDGSNYGQLATEFGMTERGARKMIERAKRQGNAQ